MKLKIDPTEPKISPLSKDSYIDNKLKIVKSLSIQELRDSSLGARKTENLIYLHGEYEIITLENGEEAIKSTGDFSAGQIREILQASLVYLSDPKSLDEMASLTKYGIRTECMWINYHIPRKFWNEKEEVFQEATEYLVNHLLEDGNILNITGMPGSGKTVTLLHMAKTLAERGDKVIYFKDPSEIANELTFAIYNHAFHSMSIAYYQGKSISEQAVYIMEIISELMEKAYLPDSDELQKLYMIFDQVKDFKDIEAYIPSAKNVKIIIASQNSKIHLDMPEGAISLEMPPFFSPDEAKEYMTKALEKKRPDMDIDKLLWEHDDEGILVRWQDGIPKMRFAHNPYYLEKTANFLTFIIPSLSIDKYIKKLKKGRFYVLYFKLLFKNILEESNLNYNKSDKDSSDSSEKFIEKYIKTKSKTKPLSEQNKQELLDGIDKVPLLLQYLSYLDGEFISKDLVKSFLDVSDSVQEMLISKLLSLSLVTEIVNNQGKCGIKIDREMQKSILQFIDRYNKNEDVSQKYFETDKVKIFESLLKSLENLTPRIIDGNKKDFAIVLPHIKKVNSMLKEDQDLKLDSNFIKLLFLFQLKLDYINEKELLETLSGNSDSDSDSENPQVGVTDNSSEFRDALGDSSDVAKYVLEI